MKMKNFKAGVLQIRSPRVCTGRMSMYLCIRFHKTHLSLAGATRSTAFPSPSSCRTVETNPLCHNCWPEDIDIRGPGNYYSPSEPASSMYWQHNSKHFNPTTGKLEMDTSLNNQHCCVVARAILRSRATTIS